MPRKTLHLIASASLVLLLLLIIAISGLLLWVATGPREVAVITPYLEEALTPEDGSFKVTIGSTQLHWDGWLRPIGLHTNNVKVTLPHRGVQARLPEVILGIDFSGILLGDLRVKALTIKNPAIRLYRTQSGAIGFGIGDAENEASPPHIISLDGKSLAEGGEDGSPLGGLKRIEITNARLALHNYERGEVLASPNSNILVVSNENGILVNLSTSLIQGDRSNAKFHVRTVADLATGNIGVSCNFTDVAPKLLAQLIPDNPWFRRFSGGVSGNVQMVISDTGRVMGGDFTITGNEGKFSHPEFFSDDIILRKISASGSFGDGGKYITVEKARFDLAQKLSITLNGQRVVTDEGVAVKLDARADGIEAGELDKYWPLPLAPLTRRWVTENVSAGELTGEISLNIKPAMLNLPALPREAVQARVTVKGGAVRYLPDHPPIKDIDAVIDFTGDSMSMEATHAHFMHDVTSKRVALQIPDFNADALMLHTDFDITAGAKDVAEFLSRPQFTFARRINFLPENISGSVSGKVSLEVLLYETLADGSESEGDLKNFEIDAKLHDVSQDNLFGKYNISAADGNLHVDNDALTFAGRVKLQGAEAKLDINSDFTAGKTTVKAGFTDISMAQLRTLGYPLPQQMGGSVALTAQMEISGEDTKIIADADITPAVLVIPEAGLLKPTGTPGRFSISASENTKSGKVEIDRFELQSQGIYASGTALFDGDGTLHRLDLKRFVAGNNDLSALYERNGKMINVTAGGKALDLSGMMNKEENGDGFSQNMFDNQKVNLHFAEVIFGKKRSAYTVNARWNCDHIRCYNAYVSANLRERKTVDFRIYADGNKRKLKLKTTDAGEFLRVLDVIGKLRGGSLVVEAAFDDRKSGNPLTGRVTIRDFALKQAPILTKILTIASLTGIVDALAGNGISFSKMVIPFVLVNDVATVKDAKSYGASIGITASGTLNIKTAETDMKGVVVPAYTLNSVLGQIPIIGELAGGDEGLFAANYSVKGVYPDKAEVSVNPLSILTPGFLRGIFDVPEQQRQSGS